VQVDALAIRLRPRTPFEAADLGARLCQHAARDVYRCYLLVAVPVAAAAIASYEIAGWLPFVLLWWAKPWLDRTILFVLSRSAFGQSTSPAQLWRARRDVWWRQLLFTLTERRLSPWRSLTQPVYQLEGVAALKARSRVAQVRRTARGAAMLVTFAYTLAQLALMLALFSLLFWMSPFEEQLDISRLVSDEPSPALTVTLAAIYAAVVVFLEPFFVSAGFAMYLNRRAALEAWDIEQEFRRAFAR
jgi:hypothetical protein